MNSLVGIPDPATGALRNPAAAVLPNGTATPVVSAIPGDGGYVVLDSTRTGGVGLAGQQLAGTIAMAVARPRDGHRLVLVGFVSTGVTTSDTGAGSAFVSEIVQFKGYENQSGTPGAVSRAMASRAAHVVAPVGGLWMPGGEGGAWGLAVNTSIASGRPATAVFVEQAVTLPTRAKGCPLVDCVQSRSLMPGLGVATIPAGETALTATSPPFDAGAPDPTVAESLFWIAKGDTQPLIDEPGLELQTADASTGPWVSLPFASSSSWATRFGELTGRRRWLRLRASLFLEEVPGEDVPFDFEDRLVLLRGPLVGSVTELASAASGIIPLQQYGQGSTTIIGQFVQYRTSGPLVLHGAARAAAPAGTTVSWSGAASRAAALANQWTAIRTDLVPGGTAWSLTAPEIPGDIARCTLSVPVGQTYTAAFAIARRVATD